MKSTYLYPILLLVLMLSCKDDDDYANRYNANAENQIKGFVWNGLNSWYYWQQNVEDLADNRFSSDADFNAFLSAYSSPENLFYNLLYDYPNTDRFSWIVSDYNALLAQFQGSSDTYGFKFGLVQIENTGEYLGYVRYVLPNTPASNAGLQRGDLFTRVNGSSITLDNYTSLLFGNQPISLGLAEYDANGNIVETTTTSSLNKVSYSENPVYYTHVYEINNKKIGYLVYNAFTSTYNGELNQAFQEFQNQNITDLVLDMRYNGGGSVRTASYLASMINGMNLDQPFAKLIFNTKHQNQNTTYTFTNQLKTYDKNTGNENGTQTIHALSLNKIYVLATYNTASASELIINGLSPFIEVVHIGDTTRGKNNGSITLFDNPSSDYTSLSGANPNHTYAMQPLVFHSFNANDFGDYANGFTPNYVVDELNNLSDIKALGDVNEPMLQYAIGLITGNTPFPNPTTEVTREAASSSQEQSLGFDMYIEPF